MQPADLNITLFRGDDGRVTFPFVDGDDDNAPLSFADEEISLELTWRGGAVTLSDGEGLVVDGAAGVAVWTVTPELSGSLPQGKVTRIELVRTNVADGRRTYGVGRITATDDAAPGDQTALVAVRDLTVQIVVSMAMRGPGVAPGGEAGQLLAKVSGDDYDTEWVDQSGGPGGAVSWEDILDKPETFPPAEHEHQPDDIVGLPAALTKLAGISAGATANQADGFLLDRANHSGTQAQSTIVGLASALAGKQADLGYTPSSVTGLTGVQSLVAFKSGLALASTDISNFSAAADARITAQKGATSGLAPLDSGGKIPNSYLPAIAITSVFVVASQVAQLALTAEEGDVAVRSDLNQSYIHNSGASGTMADWTLLATPTDAVLSFAGRTGAIVLTLADVTAALAYTPQPQDADLTAIAALTTVAYGRSLLTLADAVALRTSAGLVLGTDIQAFDPDLAAIAALVTTNYGRAFLTMADAAAAKTALAVAIADVSGLQAALDLKANISDTLNTQTGTTYTLQASDNGKVVEMNNASAVAVTVPNSLAVGFNCILSQTGAGLVTVAAGSGATVNAYGGLKSPGQWGELSLRVRANSGGSSALAVLGGGVA